MSNHEEFQQSLDQEALYIAYVKFLRSERFSPAFFSGFTSLRVLTYSASIPMIAQMLDKFEKVECIFGFEGILSGLEDILACQKSVCEDLATVIKGLGDQRKRFILERVSQGDAQLYVVKDAISHAKLYLLESATRRMVLTGSANFSMRALSGRQVETLQALENDDEGWEFYCNLYETVRRQATNHIAPRLLTAERISLEDLPLFEEVQQAKTGVTVFVNTDTTSMTLPRIIHTHERLTEIYKAPVQTVIKPKKGRLTLTPEVVGKIVHLSKSLKRSEQTPTEPEQMTLNLETGTILLNNKELDVSPPWKQVQSDVQCILEYFDNYQLGFHGNIAQLQRDYFLFLCWFYSTPFICDFRNQAIAKYDYIFDFPSFAILYGKSNSGKTELIRTLMTSMFGVPTFMDKSLFTRATLRRLMYAHKRFPLVFDDVTKRAFNDHAPDIIKDENVSEPEYPAIILSMNTEEHGFSTELRKRCLILYSKASLPDYTGESRTLYKSVHAIRSRISTGLYHEFLRRLMDTLKANALPQDMLVCSSNIITSIFAEATSSPLPPWCAVMSMQQDYEGRKYEKIRAELRKMYETQPSSWRIRRDEVILSVPLMNIAGLRKDIPDSLLKEGSRGGQIILDRKELEEFLHISLRKRWWQRILGVGSTSRISTED
jgi:hypothetical protein